MANYEVVFSALSQLRDEIKQASLVIDRLQEGVSEIEIAFKDYVSAMGDEMEDDD